MGKAKIKLKISNTELNQIIDKKRRLIMKNIESVLKKQALPHLIDLIMIGYDSLGDRANMGPEDPTNPSNWRQEFKSKLEEDFRNTFIVTGTRLTVKIGEKSFLGYDPSGKTDPNDDSPLIWLVYYIEGLIGDFAFITPADYESFRGAGRYDSRWGRFGQGFMISKEDYEEEGWSDIIPFSQVRHPFSGFSPLDIFTEALNEFRIRPFIQKAIDAALGGRKL